MNDKLSVDAIKADIVTFDAIPQWFIIDREDGEIRIPLIEKNIQRTLQNFGDTLALIKKDYPQAFKLLEQAGIEWLPKEKGKGIKE